MALTLPYPDLDFVPLDILTAEEMNEIVANYTFISNQFPIASSNINWASLPWRAVTPTAGTGVTIAQNNSVYNETLKVVNLSLSLTFTNGMPAELLSGLPQPSSSRYMVGVLNTADVRNPWVRTNGTMAVSATSGVTSINIGSTYSTA